MATTNGNFHNQDQYKTSESYTPANEATEQTQTNSANHDLTKDEVGWYFVEQYYTTLSKNPDKLHLFYGKRSQFVFGEEAEVANISVGRPAIKDRIKELDFQECKVRVSNVDSLASSPDTILIQVIGETSNKKSEEPRKFVQTFVLAKQPSGYFVLNDIWRYISEDEEEPSDAATQEDAKPIEQPTVVEAPAVPEVAPEEPTKAEESEEESEEEEAVEATPALEAETVDKKLEEVAKAEALAETVEETPVEAPKAEATKSETSESATDGDNASLAASEEALKAPEKPKEPAPTPAVPSAKAAAAAAPAPAAEPEKPAPAKPLTWASRIAAATATPPAAQPRAPAPVAAPKAAPVPAPASQRTEPAAAAAQDSTSSGSEWQTAGSDSKKQNRPQSMIAQSEDKGTLGYVKYVTEKVQDAELKAALSRFGGLTYFDINREKNCAFVEFATPEGYKAAVAANPHLVNGENIVVEQRRPKSTAYGGAQYAANRGGASGRGRGRYDGTRSGSQGGPKAPFNSQTRGRGGGAARGKGSSQTNA
ncbi:hypothetical protein jhhlp_004631 [Lomentospora prolificans]|uniref:NTF2 domain-containing protein n=1 Tax=Lomentospora prolificans TaxID=41688 RepID=A0A2N3NC17_9PEZI|nr:hypothetical protein jhhlp_004631 [Lomentospora prolificans]